LPKYVIEREIPGAGSLSPQQLQAISQKSCSVLNNLGPSIQWVQSYVTNDKVYCIYIAPNEALIREHAAQGGFPANRISEVKTIIDPTKAETKTCSPTARAASVLTLLGSVNPIRASSVASENRARTGVPADRSWSVGWRRGDGRRLWQAPSQGRQRSMA